MTRLFFGILLTIMGTSCTTALGAPLEPDEDAPVLASDLTETDLAIQEISEQDIIVPYPAGWAIIGGEIVINIANGEDQFPWKLTSSPTNPQILITTMGSYADRSNRRMRIPQSAAIVLSGLPKGASGEMLEPVTSVNINGRDGATLLVGNEYWHKYYVAVRVTAHKIAILTAEGPADKSEEMQSILNAIALNIRPLD